MRKINALRKNRTTNRRIGRKKNRLEGESKEWHRRPEHKREGIIKKNTYYDKEKRTRKEKRKEVDQKGDEENEDNYFIH